TVLPPFPTMEWVKAHPWDSLDQVPCIANEPVASDRSAAPPVVPGDSQAHLSMFSSPEESVHPPAGFWSVMVSEYSCPSTMEKPSVVPALPELTKFCPQLVPRSRTYGMLVKAMSPTEELAPTSPFQSCHAHQPPFGKLSGCVPDADRMTYWA